MELAEFCLDHATKYDLTRPFKLSNHPGKVFCTDGRWLAWVKEEDNKTLILSETPPTIPDTWIIDFEVFDDIPDVQLAREKCNYCEDGISKEIDCIGCDGSGETSCGECDQPVDCYECHGDGKMPGEGRPGEKCSECNGIGSYDNSPPVKIYDKTFGAVYLSKLKAAGAKVTMINHLPELPLLGFKFGNITGFLLGITIH